MIIYVLTLFPEIFENVFSKSIIKRTLDKKILSLKLINLRNFGIGKHKQVDDKPFGGGAGMVMMVDPIVRALESIKPKPYTVLLSASGLLYDQPLAKSLSGKKSLAIICGHYEGIDARVEEYAHEIISIGDFVLTGGELPAMLIVDSVARLLPGAINELSAQDESFTSGQLEYPQFTRPESYKGKKVPAVLLSGNHAEINDWRRKESVKRTKKFRPDLLEKTRS